MSHTGNVYATHSGYIAHKGLPNDIHDTSEIVDLAATLGTVEVWHDSPATAVQLKTLTQVNLAPPLLMDARPS